MANDDINSILNILNVIKEDDGIPRNVKARIDSAICCLNNGEREIPLKINSALQELEEISTDKNLDEYNRLEILKIIGVLGGYQ